MRLIDTVGCLAVALMLGLASCAQHAPRDAKSASSDVRKPGPTTGDYRRYVKGATLAFNLANVTDWDSPDPNHVVVWTSPVEAYLLTLFGACFNLQSSQTILLSHGGGAGAVMVGGERCPIQAVERLDARAMKADGLH
jgi:hypothetical protein